MYIQGKAQETLNYDTGTDFFPYKVKHQPMPNDSIRDHHRKIKKKIYYHTVKSAYGRTSPSATSSGFFFSETGYSWVLESHCYNQSDTQNIPQYQ